MMAAMQVFELREIRVMLALVLGLLIGAERERRRGDRGHVVFAGIRTFGLVGLLGGMLAYLGSTPLLVAGLLSVASLASVGYFVNRRDDDRGITTEVAMLVTFALGVLAERAPTMAAASGVLVTALLALRASLHRAVREALSPSELRDVLLLLIVALVVLPATPDVHIGPFDAIHPPSLARLVALLMFINVLGHLAQRVLGPKFGLTLAGLAGGFVSSSATIGSMSMRAKAAPQAYLAAVAAALASCVATSVQYLLIVAAIDASLLRYTALPLGASLACALLATGLCSLLAIRAADQDPAKASPFRLTAALLFVAVYALVSVASAGLQQRLGAPGLILVSAAAGIVDAHSTAGSIAALHGAGQVGDQAALYASLAALSSNSLTKIVFAWSGGHVRFGSWTTLGVVAIAAAAWATLLLPL